MAHEGHGGGSEPAAEPRQITRPRSDQFGVAAIEEHMSRVLGSPTFARAPRMRRLLRFLVDETLAGRASVLKEYTIGVSVYGKPSDFEPSTSAVIRVEMGRLRKLLMQYRVEHGERDPVVIDIPKGSYVPWFSPPPATATASVASEPMRGGTDVSRSGVFSDGKATWAVPEDRRLVTVIACAVGDERAVSRSSVTHEFLTAFDAFCEQCSIIGDRHGGTVDGTSSDRILVYFGWPNAQEDAAGRALLTALEMLETARAGLRKHSLGIRIGIATSEVVTRGALVGEARHRPVVVGEALVLANELLMKAALNGILVSEYTRRLARDMFELIAAGPIDTGHCEPSLSWRLLRAKPVLTRFRACHTGLQVAVVGRQEEAGLLINRWRLSASGEGHTVVLVGEAGIGKSKLAETLLQQIEPESTQIRVQCSLHHANSTLYPFIELLKAEIAALAAAGVAFAEQSVRLLRRFSLGEPLDRLLLDALLSRPGETAIAEVSASQQKDLTLQLLLRVLCAQVRERPTVLLVEDIHWADPTSLDLLEQILGLAANTSLLLLLTTRQELPADFARHTNLTSIRLARLPKRDCNALIDAMLSEAVLPDAARSLILDKAEGIPLFLEEMTKLFLASADSGSPVASLPESLSDLLVSQLDRLGPLRSVAQVAAVIGRQFTQRMLAYATGRSEQDLDGALDQLVAARIIVREGTHEAGVFSFRHALLREAAYGSLIDHARRELHRSVSSLLLRCFPELASEHPEIVSRHLTEAGRHGEAAPYWVTAGRKATTRYALTEAIADFRLALESLRALPDGRNRRERELEVLLEMGLAIRNLRGYGDEELASIYQVARTLASDLGKLDSLANAVYGLWTHATGRSDWRTAVTLATEFERLAHEQDDDGQSQVEAFRLQGASAAFRGEFLIARTYFERALAAYDGRRHGPRFGFDPASACAAYLAWTLWHLGDKEQARAHAQTALGFAEAKRHPATLAMVLSWLMFYEVCEQNPQGILALNSRLQLVCAERDCRYWQPFGTACAAWAGFQQDGDARHLGRLIESTRHFGDRYLTSCLLILAAEVCAQLGRTEQGLEIAASAREFIEDHDERVWEAECGRVTAVLLMKQAAPDLIRANQLIHRAIRTVRRQQARGLEERMLATRALLDQRIEKLSPPPTLPRPGTVH
jgi:class 3 adenylate cyclase/energy-coupling factor transporter ATP-binding protein EcfA2